MLPPSRVPWRALLFGCALALLGAAPAASFHDFLQDYSARFDSLHLAPFTLDFREHLKNVADPLALAAQDLFFTEEDAALRTFHRADLAPSERVLYDVVDHAITFHRQRIALEQRWVANGRPMPEHSLYELPEHEAWYALFVQQFTGTSITPEEVHQLGEQETARCLREIDALRRQLGFADSASFQHHLQDPRFICTDEATLMTGFARIDSTARAHLRAFVDVGDVPPVRIMEWPKAGPNTPPGMYRSMEDDTLQVDAFLFNFLGHRFNTRTMTWLYMHEAIPGHHLQVATRRAHPIHDLRDGVFEPGISEGWACYVEYYGDDLGLYTDPYQRLGKWEWDLVRSVRLVMDAGINYYGWSHEQALAYWRSHVPGQEGIAEREVTRVTNWTAQALSYKVGADRIQRMREHAQRTWGAAFTPARFHRALLDLGQVPIDVAENALETPPPW